jgi:hypothetical protein
MSAAETKSPTLSALPLLVSVPTSGRLAMRTARKALAGASFGSEKPKSATVKV